MIVERVGNLIFNVCFKNSIVSISNASNIFLSDIGDSLRLNEKLNKILISKFNSYGVDCCKNGISHIKFLVKYSPILSKIIDITEFNSIEYCSAPLEVYLDNCYISITNHGKFFCINDVIANSSDIRTSIPKKFKQYLKLDRRNPISFRWRDERFGNIDYNEVRITL